MHASCHQISFTWRRFLILNQANAGGSATRNMKPMEMRTIGAMGRGCPSRFPAAPKRARPTDGSAAAGLVVSVPGPCDPFELEVDVPVCEPDLPEWPFAVPEVVPLDP